MIFQRSLIREFSLVAIAVVAVLMAIILTRLLILYLGKAAGGSVLPEAVLGLLAFSLLNYMPIILGLSMFIAILLVLTRSHLDSEMTVWFTTGLSIAAWVRPVLQFCLPVALICAALSLVISPWSQDRSAEFLRLLDSRSDVSQVTPGVFRESRQSDRVFFVDKLSERSDVVNNVFVQSLQNNKLGVIVAQRGFQETAENGDTFIVLENGRRYEGVPGTLDYRVVDFERYAIRMEPREAKRESQPNKAKTSMDLLADPTAAGDRGIALAGRDPDRHRADGAGRNPAFFREPACRPVLEPPAGCAHLRGLLQFAVDLPGVDRAGKDPDAGRALAGACGDGRPAGRALLAPPRRVPLAGFRALSGSLRVGLAAL